MSKELNALTTFMKSLLASGMRHDSIVSRGYAYALALYLSNAELEHPQGTEISSTLQVQLMGHAADLLKVVAKEMGLAEAQEVDDICVKTLPKSSNKVTINIQHMSRAKAPKLDVDEEQEA